MTLSMAIAGAQDIKPLVIAHRGASGYLPEHTVAAKAYAYALGADFLEQDLVLSKDGVPVVLHDIHLDTVTDVARSFPERHRPDGRYYALDFTVAELKTLQVTERFNPTTGQPVYPRRFPAGQTIFRISTFEEEIQLIQGLNRSTGRNIGIYPEIKQPRWHLAEGRDLSRAVLPILERYGYKNKTDACWVQCFEVAEVRRWRGELGWKGRLVMLLGGGAKSEDGTDFDYLCSPAGLKELAAIVDGIGPPIGRIISGRTPGERRVTPLARQATELGLVVHPYTIRIDELPKMVATDAELHAALFDEAGVQGVFSDFPDVTIDWLKKAKKR